MQPRRPTRSHPRSLACRRAAGGRGCAMTAFWQAWRAFSPSLRRVLFAWGIVTLVLFGLLGVLLNLYLVRLGFDARFIGLRAGLGQVVWALAALPAGALGARIGLRNGLALGVGLLGLGVALLLLVEALPAAVWRAWLLGGTGVAYVGIALISVLMAPYLMAAAEVAQRPYVFTALHALIPAGALLGSLLAGPLPGLWAGWLGTALDQPAPYRLALWLGPFLLGLSLLPLLRAGAAPLAAQPAQPDAAQADAAQADAARPWARLVWFGAVVLLSAIALNTVRTFFNVYLDRGLGASPATIGAVMGVGQVLPLVVVFTVPPLLKRWGAGATLAGGLAGMALGLLPLALVPLLGAAAVAYMAFQAVVAVTNAARDLFGQELVVARWRTTSQAVATLGGAVGALAAGIGGGLLVERSGFGALYATGALAALLAAGLLLAVVSRQSSVGSGQ